MYSGLETPGDRRHKGFWSCFSIAEIGVSVIKMLQMLHEGIKCVEQEETRAISSGAGSNQFLKDREQLNIPDIRNIEEKHTEALYPHTDSSTRR